MRYLTVIVVLTMLTGCSERRGLMQTYPGPPLPRDQVARIGGTFQFYGVGAKAVLLLAVDGQRVSEGDLELLPGQHTVAMTYETDSLAGTDTSIAPCYVTFQAEAGHSYVTRGNLRPTDPPSWYCAVSDLETRAFAEGTFDLPTGWTLDVVKP